jgi:hypothetical protein
MLKCKKRMDNLITPSLYFLMEKVLSDTSLSTDDKVKLMMNYVRITRLRPIDGHPV